MSTDLLTSESIEIESRPKEGDNLSVEVLAGSRNVRVDSNQTSSSQPPSDDTESQAISMTPPAVFSTGSSDGNGNRNSQPTSPAGSSNSNSNAISLDEIKFGCSSYHAMFTPVAITMILSALAVTYIQTPDLQNAQTDAISSTYTVFDVSDGAASNNSNLKNLGLSLVNGLIIVSVIGAMTFLIVILYKYRCMKLILGYMVLSSALLLGFMGGYMFHIFIQVYGFVMDYLTFFFIVVNFAAAGTVAVFFGRGNVPSVITQMYLIATSVILAWQLSHFNEWTAWTLLVLLALYDLCAVLTPCGPLKALIKLMQRDNSPDLPGLLYEARLPDGVSRPGRSRNTNTNATATNTANGESSSSRASENQRASSTNSDQSTRPQPSTDTTLPSNGNQRMSSNNYNTDTRTRRKKQRQSNAASDSDSQTDFTTIASTAATRGRHTETSRSTNTYEIRTLPFAICKIYKLQVTRDNNCPPFIEDKYNPVDLANGTGPRPTYTPEELKTNVTVLFPRRGGRITVQHPEDGDESARRRRTNYHGENLSRYIVTDPNGDVKRVLVMKDTGKVYEEVQGQAPSANSDRSGDDDANGGNNNTIKLGLGDFIFYSVLVSKAAMYSFTTFAACTLTILAGLGGTLVLLSVYHAALPALPISIFLGVMFYFVTRALIEPWIETIMVVPFYV